MRLNPDCVRDILLWVEDNTSFGTVLYFPSEASVFLKEKYEKDVLIYHAVQCAEHGFIKAGKADFSGYIPVMDLTPAGHEFLANIRNEENFSKAKALAKSAGSVALSVLRAAAEGVMTAALNKQLGL